MKIYSGKYDNKTQASNALVTNLMKYPEIERRMTRQFPQYSLAYFVDGTGRFAKEKTIGDTKYTWPILGRTSRPSTCTGTNTGNGASRAAFTVEFEENYLNPNDIVKFADGNHGHILGLPVPSTNGYTYTFKLADPAGTASVAAAALLAGVTVGKIGSGFSEGSDRGFENHVYPDWYVNYLGISRKASSITGSALTDVTWIESGGSKLWYFTDQMICEEEFRKEREMDAWYSISTMDANGNPTLFDPSTGKAIVKGDGILRQIDAANIDTYNGVLTHARLTEFLNQLILNTGNKGTKWMVFTGRGGALAFHNAMENFVMPNGNMIYNAATGKEMTIGVEFNSYAVLGVQMTLVDTPMFDDPNLWGNNIDPVSGLPKESFRMVFMNFDYNPMKGEANVERIVKGAEGYSRGYMMKYIAGMVNPLDNKQMMASTSRDNFTVEYLSESGIIVRNPMSCGMLVFA